MAHSKEPLSIWPQSEAQIARNENLVKVSREHWVKPGTPSLNPKGRPVIKPLKDALLRMLDMTPVEFEAYQPVNMHEATAKEQINAMMHGDGKNGDKAKIFASIASIVQGRPEKAEEDRDTQERAAPKTLIIDMFRPPVPELPPATEE